MIDVKQMRANIKSRLKEEIGGDSGAKYLKIIQVEGDLASNAYTKGKKKDCDEIGLKYKHVLLPNDSMAEDVMAVIKIGNNDPNCIGIILQLPLPEHLKEFQEDFLWAIVEKKDVDGFTPNSPHTPCTPAGILYIMKEYFKGALAGKIALIIGRGRLVGRPLVPLLDKENMTVIQANSYTPPNKLKELCEAADVIITATGHTNTLNALNISGVKDDTLIIDAGINRDENGKMVGDCNPFIYKIHDNITPVPGGVGLMTRVMLLDNCIKAMKI